MTSKQEEMINKAEARKATRQEIREALSRLEKERIETLKALGEINEKTAITLSVFYLRNAAREDLLKLDKEGEQHKIFIEKIYPKIKVGFEKLILAGFIDKRLGKKDKSKES
jgi:hypothetical protein